MATEHRTFKVHGMHCFAVSPDPRNEKPSVSRVASLLFSDTGNPAQCMLISLNVQ